MVKSMSKTSDSADEMGRVNEHFDTRVIAIHSKRGDMTRKLFNLGVISGALLALFVSSAILFAQCGVERWSVKTGTDPDAGSVNVASATPTTIASLIALSAPQPIPSNNRITPTETTVWTIDATLTSFKVEGDSDYHLVIADKNSNTMIAEIPSPNCVTGTSPFSSLISQARAKFDAAFTVGSSFQNVSVPVRVTGVGMFDFLHGQRGVAANGIELHPVVDIVFNPGSDFSIGASQSSLSLMPGSSGTLSLSVDAVGSAGPAVSMSASGTPPGITVSFSPNPVPVGSTTAAVVFVDPSTTPGSYPVTLTGGAGSTTHAASITVNVLASSTADFSFSATPAAVAIGLGGSNVVAVSTTANATFSADVSLSVSGLPAGVTASFNNPTIPAPGTGSSTLTITAGTTTVAGTAAITVVATSGGISHSTVLNVLVCSGATPASPAMSHIAPRVVPRTGSQGEDSESAEDTTARDEDDSPVQVLPTPSALLRARRHTETEICHPHEYAVFLGHGWSDPSNLNLKKELGRSKVSLTGTICGASGRTTYTEKTLDAADGTVPAKLSDLQIQAQLVGWLQHGVIMPPTEPIIYVIFLAPEIRSTLGSSIGGQDYFAYENHFHALSDEIRYIVVPFDTDSRREAQTVSRAILKALVAP